MFRHLQCQNPSIISESIGIPNGSEKMGKKVRNGTRNTERNLIHIEEDSYLRGQSAYIRISNGNKKREKK